MMQFRPAPLQAAALHAVTLHAVRPSGPTLSPRQPPRQPDQQRTDGDGDYSRPAQALHARFRRLAGEIGHRAGKQRIGQPLQSHGEAEPEQDQRPGSYGRPPWLEKYWKKSESGDSTMVVPSSIAVS